MEYDEFYDDLMGDYGLDEDEFGSTLLWEGWFDEDLDPDERQEARDAFFEYTGMDPYDFDWEAWREYMGYE